MNGWSSPSGLRDGGSSPSGLRQSIRWVVLDLEATCWAADEDKALAADQRNECEIIEIGAVRVDPVTWEIAGDQAESGPAGASSAGAPEFRAVVRPRRHPRLSPFCTRLTGITQEEVDAAEPFPEVFRAFLDWAGGDEGLVVASWGAWDDRQLRRDAARWGLPEPRWQGFNVKRLFARRARAGGRAGGRPAPGGGWMGLSAAVAHLGGAFQGQPHRGLDDARNVAWVLAQIRRAEAAAAPPDSAAPAAPAGDLG